METGPGDDQFVIMGRQGLWAALLLKSNPESGGPAFCEEFVQRYMLQYEDILAHAYLNSSNQILPPDPVAEFQPQLKRDFVQNCLHDLAVISVEVDRYEIRVNQKVRHHNRRLEELARVANYRGNGFAQDYFGLPASTSIRKSIGQTFILSKYVWEDPLKFCQLALTHLLKIRESRRMEWGIHWHFRGGFLMKKEEEMEVPLELNLKKTYQRYLRIEQCTKRGPPLALADTVGRLRLHITKDIALPLLDHYKWKLWAAQKIRRNVQNKWRESELSYMASLDASRKLGILYIVALIVFVMGFTFGYFLQPHIRRAYRAPLMIDFDKIDEVPETLSSGFGNGFCFG